jgi:metal-responsive CopG/Arc/MetJ family transcriptional regulator
MGKQISLVLDDDIIEALDEIRRNLGLSNIQDVIRVVIPEGLKRYKEEKKGKA